MRAPLVTPGSLVAARRSGAAAIALAVAWPLAAGCSRAEGSRGGPPGAAHAAALAVIDAQAAAPPCPDGMVLVRGTFCPYVTRRCLRQTYNQANHLSICHEFEPGSTRCVDRPGVSPEATPDAGEGVSEERAFCIDRFEYPNEEGGHPPWMVSWYDGEATCRSKGKRLCYESEWTMACEGPEKTPFPYGWVRDPEACNFDHRYRAPVLEDLMDAGTAPSELLRLDESVPSGKRPRCVSGYGVHDLTGNFDEWVTLDQPFSDKVKVDTSRWSGLKGGAWGSVRNACRPVTTSHAPQWTYYFVSFRCCRDADGFPPYVPSRAPTPAPQVAPKDRAPPPKLDAGLPPPRVVPPAIPSGARSG